MRDDLHVATYARGVTELAAQEPQVQGNLNETRVTLTLASPIDSIWRQLFAEAPLDELHARIIRVDARGDIGDGVIDVFMRPRSSEDQVRNALDLVRKRIEKVDALHDEFVEATRVIAATVRTWHAKATVRETVTHDDT